MKSLRRILVVEDDDPKWVALNKFLSANFPEFELNLERSLQSAVRYIRSKHARLILLDMTLPNFDTGPDEHGGVTHSFGGREFLRQMDRFDVVTPVIVFTQFEAFTTPGLALRLPELDEQLRVEHTKNYRGAVYYNAMIQAWEHSLKEKIEAVLAEMDEGEGC